MNPWYPKRGEIYFAQLDKSRPVVIVSVDGRNQHAKNVIVVPVSETYRDYPFHVVLSPGESGLGRPCAAKCEQVTTIEKSQIGPNVMGRLGRDKMRDIERGIMQAIGVFT